MRVGISGNEWWPVLEIEEDEEVYELEYEVTEEELARYKAALTEWRAVQAVLQQKMAI